MDINTKFNNAIDDVVKEVELKHWKKAVEASTEIASMIKSSGLGKSVYLAVMENLEIAIRRNGGQEAVLDFGHVLKHRDNYLSNSVIVLPRV